MWMAERSCADFDVAEGLSGGLKLFQISCYLEACVLTGQI